MGWLRALVVLAAVAIGLACGCLGPGRPAVPTAPNPNRGSATVQIRVDASELLRSVVGDISPYHAQYIASNVKELVVGLYDTSTDPPPVFGEEVSSASAAEVDSTATPSYQDAIVGTGSYSSGALALGSYALTSAQKVDFKRCFYSDVSYPLAIPTSTTFSFTSVPGDSGGGRFIAFAAALSTNSFDTSYPASDSYVIGFASASVGPVLEGQTTDGGTLALALSRNVGTVTLDATVKKGSKDNLTQIQQVVFGVVATQSALSQPLTLGYRSEYAVGSTSPTPYSSPTASPYDYFTNVENNTGAIGLVDKTTWQRYLWTDRAFSGAQAFEKATSGTTQATTSATLTEVPYSLSNDSGDYRAYILCTFKGTGKDSYSTVMASGSVSFQLTSTSTTVNVGTITLP